MNRRYVSLILVLVLLLTGCGRDIPGIESSSGPGRMVRRIEVAIHPEDPDYDRTYVTQENMNALLALLRAMVTLEEPEEEPDLEGGQSYYTATVTFANGQQSRYWMLGHTYLRLGDEDWCVIDTAKARSFIQFLLEHPSDDVPATETTAPPETTN